MRHSEETVKAGIFGIAGNVILFLIKIILFFFSGSIAILADSFHTLTDSISSLLMLAGIYKSRTPPDREHPYGHGKTEYFVMVFMAIILVFAGFMFSKEAALRIMNPIELKIDVWILTGLLFTILIKEAMSLYAFRVVRRTGSKIVQVDAWHHRFDTITSVFVLFSLIVQRFGIVRMDGIAGFVVGILIAALGFKFLKDAYDRIIGVPPSIDMVNGIKEIAMGVEGVRAVHDFIISNVESFPIITFHIEVDRNLSVEKAHSVADEVEKMVQKEYGGVCVVHVDPACEDQSVREMLKCLKERIKDVEVVQDVYTVSKTEKGFVVEIVFKRNTEAGKKEEVMDMIREELVKRFGVENIEFQERPGFLPEK